MRQQTNLVVVFTLVLFGNFVSSCTPTALDDEKQLEKWSNDAYEDALASTASATTTTSPARGTKKCIISQIKSAHKAKTLGPGKSRKAYRKRPSLVARVFPGGGVGLAVTEDTFPGTKSYFRLDGRRFSGEGSRYVMVDSAGVRALKADNVVQFSWTDWPYRAEKNDEDVLVGLAKAYDDCMSFLKS